MRRRDRQQPRVAVSFDAELVPALQNKDLAMSWYLVPKEFNVISDMVYIIRTDFMKKMSGVKVKLTLSGFVLPHTASIDILRDGDVITISNGGSACPSIKNAIKTDTCKTSGSCVW